MRLRSIIYWVFCSILSFRTHSTKLTVPANVPTCRVHVEQEKQSTDCMHSWHMLILTATVLLPSSTGFLYKQPWMPRFQSQSFLTISNSPVMPFRIQSRIYQIERGLLYFYRFVYSCLRTFCALPSCIFIDQYHPAFWRIARIQTFKSIRVSLARRRHCERCVSSKVVVNCILLRVCTAVAIIANYKHNHNHNNNIIGKCIYWSTIVWILGKGDFQCSSSCIASHTFKCNNC